MSGQSDVERQSLYHTEELSAQMWPDFERLFSRGNGWDHCWCMAFQQAHHLSRQEVRTRAEMAVINHQDKQHRRRGVAGIALRAALEAIRARGGGLVEAYPIAGWTHRREGSAAALHVQGVGPVAPAFGSFGNVSTPGTVSIFAKGRL